jgi:hypothetical protein
VVRFKLPFFKQFPNEESAGFMVDLLASAAFRFDGGIALRSVAKTELFRQFTEPFKDEPPETLESAEAALAFLVAEGMAEVVGEDVIVPVRFRDQVEVTG